MHLLILHTFYRNCLPLLISMHSPCTKCASLPLITHPTPYSTPLTQALAPQCTYLLYTHITLIVYPYPYWPHCIPLALNAHPCHSLHTPPHTSPHVYKSKLHICIYSLLTRFTLIVYPYWSHCILHKLNVHNATQYTPHTQILTGQVASLLALQVPATQSQHTCII
jgi:hypothetical protein